jgi:hypothetical protein
MIARGLAVVSGALILAAVAHVTVIATGGYGTPHSYLTLAIAFGVACGSVFSGMAWSAERYSLAVLFVVCIVGGEAYGFMQTANRLIAASEKTQAPLRANEEDRAKAKTRVTEAEARLRDVPATSKRLEKAEAAKAAADTAVIEKSADRGCRENCRQLLQAQVNAAADEVQKARAELESIKKAAETELASAREALAGLKAPESATPLADRTGIPAWILDLVTASLGSIAANGLACCLMIFGAHHPGCRVEVVQACTASSTAQNCAQLNNQIMAMPIAKTAETNESSRTPPPNSGEVPRMPTVKDHAARFAVECMRPEGEADLRDIQQRYGTWRAENAPGVRYPQATVAQALAELFEDAGIGIDERGGRFVAVGISLKEPVGVLVPQTC